MKNVVVVGAGFGGLKTALKLEKRLKHAPGYRVVLIDKNSYQTYTPLLYEVATAYRGTSASPNDFEEHLAGVVCLNLHEITKNTDVNFVQEEVQKINTDKKTIKTDAGNTIKYEYCVLSPGSEIDCSDIKGAKENCVSLKTIEEALYVRDRVENLFQELVQNKEKKNIYLNIVGTGLSGTEIAAELAKYTEHLAKAAYETDMSKVNIRLIGTGSDILERHDKRMQKLARKRLKDLGVEIVTNAHVTKISDNKIKFKGGKTYNSDLTVWAGGIKASGIVEKVNNLPLEAKNKVLVDSYMRAKDKDDVFALGDCTLFYDKKEDYVLPETAWVAEQQSEVVAHNIYALVYNYPFREYRPRYIGFISSTGGKYAIASLYGITFAGWPAWVAKRFVDLKYLISVHSFGEGFGIWFKSLKLFTRND